MIGLVSVFNRLFSMRITSKYFLALLFLFSLFSFSNRLGVAESSVEAVTNVFISTNTTWTSSNSPYIFGEIVVVETSATLTIESGVTVKFTSGYGMLVEGTLIAIGTITNPIIFTSNSSSPSIGDWDEVKLRSSLGNTFHFCIFEYANRGIAMSVSSEGIFNNCTFRYNNYGQYLSGSSGEVQYSAFLYNNYGIRSESSSQFTFTFNEIAHNNQFGIDARDKSTFTNNSIHHNVGFGIYLMSGNTHFLYNNITENIGGGISIWASSTSRIAFHFNNLINNTGYNAHREQGTPEINLSWNYWGTSNETEIQESIYDYYDDPVNRGKLNYQPYLNDSVKIFIEFSDGKMPNIAITNPSNNTTINYNVIWMNYTIDEYTAWIGYSLDNNVNITITANVLLTSLTEGTHSIVLYANDTSGNMGKSKIITFKIDFTPPIVSILSPFLEYYTEPDILVQYNRTEICTLEFYLNDVPYPFIANESIITLSDGQYNLTLMATDPAGNVGIATTIFKIDTLPPEAIIISPSGRYYNHEDLLVSWWQEPGSTLLVIYVDNNSTSLGNNSIEYFVEGNHNITLVIKDQVGNIKIITSIFDIDLTAPEITILSPDQIVYLTTDVTLSFDINDEEEVQIAIFVYLDGELVLIPNNSVIPGLTEGEHNLTIKVTDAAGNKVVEAVIFIVELPTTTITTTTTTEELETSTTTTTTTTTTTEELETSTTTTTTTSITSSSPSPFGIFGLIVGCVYLGLKNKNKN